MEAGSTMAAVSLGMAPAFVSGLVLSLSLIMSIGPQNVHVMRMGLLRRHLGVTVAVCVLADALLIAFGVWGMGQLGGLSDRLHGALLGGGVAFLAWQGMQLTVRCWRGASVGRDAVLLPHGAGGRWQAVAAAMAFSWLNPQAWLETTVLMGTASLAHGASGQTLFGAGAVAGSVLWFALLGGTVLWLGRRLQSPSVWRVLDGVAAAMMWSVAVSLLVQLF